MHTKAVSAPVASPVPRRRHANLSICDRISPYFIGSGACAGLASTCVTAIQGASPWLTVLISIPTITCLLGLKYLRKYKKLKTLNQLTIEIGDDANRISAAALSVSQVASRTLEVREHLSQEEKHMALELTDLQTSVQERTDELNRLNGLVIHLKNTNEGLQKENDELKGETEQLKKEMTALSNHIQCLREGNDKFFSSIQSMENSLDQFKKEEVDLQEASSSLTEHVTHQMKSLEQAQHAYRSAVQQLSNQNKDLQSKIAELRELISKLEKVEQALTPKLEQNRRLKQDLKEATTKLTELHYKVSSRVSSPVTSPQSTPPPATVISPPPLPKEPTT